MDHIRCTTFTLLFRFLSVIVLPVVLCTVAGCGKKKPAPSPPPVVEVVTVVQQDVPVIMEWSPPPTVPSTP